MGFFHDVRIALRSLLRAPAFGITTVLIVGLGIGMTSGMVTVFRAVLLAPLPVHDQERLVVPRLVHGGGVDAGIVASELDLLQRESRTLRSVGGTDERGAMVFPMMDGDRPVVLAQALATGNFFEVLGVRPALGRFFRPADDVRGAPPVMVISYRAWQREFGGDPGVIGRQITEPVFQWRYRIIGVAPPGLDYPLGVDYWVPAEPLGGTVATLVARLAPGVTRAAAGAELRTLMQGSTRWSASPDQLVRADVQPFVDAVAGGVRPALVVLTAAVALLLLIACVNVGNLLLLRAASRARDLAVRRALGASAGNLLRHLLAESGMLAVGGLALGLVIAVVILRVLIVVGPAQLPRSEMITLAGAPIGTAVAATLVAFLLFGVVPGVLATRGQLAASLRLGGRSGHLTRGHRRLRHVLVGAQVALALILLAGAGLLTRSLARLEGLDLGYRPEHLSIIELAVPREVSRSVLDQVQQRLRAVPGVTGVTPILVPPFIGTNVRMRRFAVEGQTAQEVGRNAFVAMESAGEQYFTTLDIPVLRGRGFTESDWEEAPMVAVVSQSVAQRFWPGRDPIGQRIRFEDDSVPRTVIGIAGDVNFRTLRESAPTVYLPWRQTQMRGGYLAARTRGDLSAVSAAMRSAVREVDARVTMWRARPMDDLLAVPMAQPRLNALLLSGFSSIALVLAALGLYGVMASLVREETRELGVRMALGATQGRVRGHVLERALVVCVGGTLVGLAGVIATSRLYTTLLFEVAPADGTALGVACGLLLSVTLVAAYLPARRATRIDPALALRAE